jgi:hypothetical protein
MSDAGSGRTDASESVDCDTPDRPVVAFYSRTGTTRQVAEDVAAAVGSARVDPIQSRRDRSYWNWLARSFLPGSTVSIEPMETDFRDAPAFFLGSPKWTLSCPPVTAFLDRATLSGVPTGVFLTYGGFDERRYAAGLVDRLRARGADVRATLLVKRDRVGSDAYHDAVETFSEAILDG